jgi:hypothetical protein
MAEFVLLYRGGGMPETEEEQAASLKAWNDWFQEVGSAVKDAGNPFAPAAKTIDAGGAVSDAKGELHTGYSIVKADSLDGATTIAKGSPVLTDGGSVTIYEIFEAM